MKISIAEGLYLIALDDEEGRLLAAAEKKIVPGLMSAALFELHLLKRIEIKGNKIAVLDLSGTGNIILDNVLRKVKTGLAFIDAIEDLAHHFKDVMDDLNELLCQRGILRREATRLMWIPLSERMDNANYAFEKEIRNSLQAMVFKSAKPTVSFVVLMSLIYDCGILDEVFKDKEELIDAVKVAKDIVDSPVLSPDISESLKVLKKYFS